MTAPERDDREEPFDEWLAFLEWRRDEENVPYGPYLTRALREIRRLQAENERLRARYSNVDVEENVLRDLESGGKPFRKTYEK